MACRPLSEDVCHVHHPELKSFTVIPAPRPAPLGQKKVYVPKFPTVLPVHPSSASDPSSSNGPNTDAPAPLMQDLPQLSGSVEQVPICPAITPTTDPHLLNKSQPIAESGGALVPFSLDQNFDFRTSDDLQLQPKLSLDTRSASKSIMLAVRGRQFLMIYTRLVLSYRIGRIWIQSLWYSPASVVNPERVLLADPIPTHAMVTRSLALTLPSFND